MRIIVPCATLILCFGTIARADVVELKNGDKINGKVGEIIGGKMKFTSPVLGDITIDMANVTTFTTDDAATIQPKKDAPVSDRITAGDATTIETASGQKLTFDQIKSINPPAQKWTGNIILNGSLSRGNTETSDLGVEANAMLRRDNQFHNDRFTLGAAYNFANTGTGDDKLTTEENWHAFGKYDRFFTEKLYGYANIRAEQDHVADLVIRVTPGVGLGYQWVESPAFNLNTEGGLSYVYEEYDPGGTNDFIALRLAYHVDKKLNDRVSVFHNLEYLPSLEDLDDFLVNADAGIRADLTKQFFSQFKVEWTYDSSPAPDRSKNDYRFLLGVGWQF